MKARNWDQATLKPIFVAAHEKITSQQKQKAQPQPQPLLEAESVSDTEEQIVLHLEYHPDDIPRKKVRELFTKTCEPIFSHDANDGGLGLKRMIIAYSRPRNLRDLRQKAKLYEKTGKEVSTYFRG